MSKNIYYNKFSITKKKRCYRNKHSALLIWFTGLSGSGKSTLANKVEINLFNNKVNTYLLDGDNIRKGINKDLNFSKLDRKENIRRVSEIAKLFIDAGIVVLASFISPYEKDRERIKKIVGKENFIEIYVKASLDICEERGVKGLYKKVREGKVENFTGISSNYEIPKNPNLEINTEELSIEDSVNIITNYINNKI